MNSYEVYDSVIIGAGPVAAAALDALADGSRTAIVTGAVPSAEKRDTLHPKIQSVSISADRPAGVAEHIAAQSRGSRPLFSTAAEGGLANYWGQQFNRLGKADAWSHGIFATFEDYEQACARIERLFSIEGGEAVDIGASSDAFGFHRPRILVGSAADRDAGLNAMTQVVKQAVSRSRAHVISDRVKSFAIMSGIVKVVLDSDAHIMAKKVFLAAGVVGDGRILMRSFPEFVGFQFFDHTPWMMYTIGSRQSIGSVHGSERRFNALNLQRNTSEGCDVFASFYDMRAADLNLLLASTLGRSYRWLRNWPSPPGSGLLTPVQVWTKATYGCVEVVNNEGRLEFVSNSFVQENTDLGLAKVVSFLKKLGVRKLRCTGTNPAFGYHYHCLRLRSRDGTWTGIAELLRDRTGGAVIPIDAAALESIGTQPHTLTAMAVAFQRVARHS